MANKKIKPVSAKTTGRIIRHGGNAPIHDGIVHTGKLAGSLKK